MTKRKKKKASGYTDWTSLPGGFDALNTEHIYPTDNRFGIPNLKHVALSAIPEKLYPYRERLKDDTDVTTTGVHFFLDDYRFESIWQRPVQTLSGIQKWSVALTPDFSLYYNTPRAIQLWNTYRTRWVGCWWSANNITVIPTVSWGNHKSYDFCFLGLPERSVLAVSTVGTKKDVSLKQLFLAGFREMIAQCNPTKVMCYGSPYEEMTQLCEIVSYPDYWQSFRASKEKAGRLEAHNKQSPASDDTFTLDF
ncbi:MAG: DUF4417 domain-containing protein [Chloroflexota bacterium]